MDGIAAASTAMSTAQVQYKASLFAMKETMDVAEDMMATLFEGLDAVMDGVGQYVDMTV